MAETPIDFRTEPARYKHWKLALGVRRRLPHHGRERGWRAEARLQAQAQLLRSRRRHRARRCRAAAALRASRDRRGGDPQPARPHLLLGRQHQHARPLDPRPQGELLQVHQRDASGHRGRDRAFRPELHLLDQRHRRRRRLRAGAGLRPDPAGRRRLERGVAARAAAARGAARHRRPDAAGRQAHGAARPRRLLLHHRRGHARQARATVAAGRQADPAEQARGRDEEDRRGDRRQVDRARRTPRASRCRPSSAPSTATRCAIRPHGRDRPRAPRRALPRQRSLLRAAGRCRRDPRPGRRLLAARRSPARSTTR